MRNLVFLAILLVLSPAYAGTIINRGRSAVVTQSSGGGGGISSINGDNTAAQTITGQNGGTFGGVNTSGGTTTIDLPDAASGARGAIKASGSQTLSPAFTFEAAPIFSTATASQACVVDGSKQFATYPYASTNTVSSLVARDASGNFAAGTITATLTGNASTATALAANPSDCGANAFAISIDASGNLTCAAAGDASTNTASSVDSEVALFSGTGGKTLKRASGTGVAHLTSGVLSASNVNLASEVTGTLPVANGGLGLTTTTAGDILYASATDTWSRLAKGTGLQILRMNSGATAPEWATSSGIGGSTGSVDKMVLTANGTGGSTLQASTSVSINASGVLVTTLGITPGGVSTQTIIGDTDGINSDFPSGDGHYGYVANTLSYYANSQEFQVWVDLINIGPGGSAGGRYNGYRTADGFPYPWLGTWTKQLNQMTTTVALTADDQNVTTLDRGTIVLTSDNATATNRTFTLSAPTGSNNKQDGQMITLFWNDTDQGEILGDGTGSLKLCAGGTKTFNAVGQNVRILGITTLGKWYETPCP